MEFFASVLAVLIYVALIILIFYSLYKSGQRERNFKRHVLEHLEEISSNIRKHY